MKLDEYVDDHAVMQGLANTIAGLLPPGATFALVVADDATGAFLHVGTAQAKFLTAAAFRRRHQAKRAA